MGDTRVFDLKARTTAQGTNSVRVGCVMERNEDGKLYALVNKDINFAGIEAPEGRDCVLVNCFPVHGRRVVINNEDSADKDVRVFNMKVRLRSYEDENGVRRNTWRTVGFIMRRYSDSKLYMLIHRYINFGGYAVPDDKDSVFVHIFPVNETEFSVEED